LLVTSLEDDNVRLLQNAHRFAGFAVLKAPDIPSVLIEIGFLSHSEEEKQLQSKAYREKVVAGIATGVDDYFDDNLPSTGAK
jgi:N-acetylmuramoyl-L-alanine amidase